MATADAGGGWVRYSWRNHASEPLYEKIALVVPVTSPSGSSYYIGVGMRNQATPSAPGPLGQPCSPGYNYPCSLRDTMSVSSHTLAHILSSSESAADTFAAIDNSFTLGDTLGDANGFYVFIYDYNDTCVLHAASPRFVGMDLGSVFRNVSMRANGRPAPPVPAGCRGRRRLGKCSRLPLCLLPAQRSLRRLRTRGRRLKRGWPRTRRSSQK